MSALADLARLKNALVQHENLTVAVSGGVDSLTLATIAHRASPDNVRMVHAVSPAVPEIATQRVRALAEAEQWRLTITGAGEFEDRRYRDNPVDRCYFCKSNLYDRIGALTQGTIASGANVDDLGEYRPGLIAAKEWHVVHPYIEAGIGKAGIRALARHAGLAEVADLPAQPCLASRVETGIAINADDLSFVNRVETALGAIVPKGSDVRCRITRDGVRIELGTVASDYRNQVEIVARQLCDAEQRLLSGVTAYRRGSMFVQVSG